MEKKFKEFKPTSWAINNKTSIYVMAILITLFGLMSYNSIPKEQVPEIVIPTIIVNTIYPGTSPTDIENLVTRPLEKNIKSINGVKNITSRSVQDFSSVVIEFETDMDIPEAKQKVKDAVDKTKKDLPNDLPSDPSVIEIDLSEIPIMYLNIAGDVGLDKLKKYAEQIQDKIESLSEITRVDIVGALDREIQINVDMYKMQLAGVSMSEIERAVMYENMTISGGTIDMYGMTRSIRVVGEFSNIKTIENIIFKSGTGAIVKLKEIAEVRDGHLEQESFSRFNGKDVITLNIIKKSGENLLTASDQIKEIVKDFQDNKVSSNVTINITGDSSKYTRTTLEDLNNTIILGFIFVTIVLMFFMGVTNAMFVGLSVPLSMALAYLVLPNIGFTMNMLVMFSFIFALGIVVDDAIVVIENTHRIFNQHKGKMKISEAAKKAAGEVFVPILSGTLTTLAPFFPLTFWPGIVGEFMFYIPVTIIITLFASLFVAYIINPIFAVTFMKHESSTKKTKTKTILIVGGLFALFSILFYIMGVTGLGSFTAILTILYVFHNLVGYKILLSFQHRFIPATLNRYEKLLRWILVKRRPYYIFIATVGLFFVSIFLTMVSGTEVLFFPDNQPHSVWVFVKMPIGTDVKVTDSVANIVEKKIYNIIGQNNPIVESVITNVAKGASESPFDNTTVSSHLAKISVNFVEFAKRSSQNTQIYMDHIRNELKGIPGAEITVEKNTMGPPTGKPINVEITSEKLDILIETTNRFKRYLDSLQIEGIEELKSDFESSKPEIVIDIDREKANNEGISTAQVGSELRTAIFGKEISKYREDEDQYPIQLRYTKEQRNNIDKLMNIRITYRDMASGKIRSIPLSSVAKISYLNTYGGINRKDLKRMITLSSNVLSGYTPTGINQQIDKAINAFKKSEQVEIKITGETEDMQETQNFLGKAMLFAILLILFILITQFNSLTKPIIILSEVIFSVIGVLLGIIIFKMPMIVAFTGMGIVALAGIVVRNGILLVEFTDVLKGQGYKTREAIILAGKTRITPVLLTAASTIIGLIPLAVGFNINFVTLLTEFNPHIFFGGDNVMFFGPLAWSIIFGLTFATFLTLVMIPVMYFIMYAGKIVTQRKVSNIVVKTKDEWLDK